MEEVRGRRKGCDTRVEGDVRRRDATLGEVAMDLHPFRDNRLCRNLEDANFPVLVHLFTK